MKQGEMYHLLDNKSTDWWQVKRPNTLATFYVPCTYIELLDDDQINYDSQGQVVDDCFSGSQGSIEQEDSHISMQVKSEADDTNLQQKNGLTSFKPKMEEDGNESLYINYNGNGKNVTNIQVHYLGKAERSTNFGSFDGGEYANLDDLRIAAGMKQPEFDTNNDQVITYQQISRLEKVH